MANPQKEHGSTQIANEILEALIGAGLNGTELAVVLLIIRKTYGWQKKEDEISLSQFLQKIPASKQTICTALNNLKLVKIIRLVKKGNSKKSSNCWAFNKNYDEWQLVKKARLVKKNKSTSQVFQNQLVKKTRHTKETSTKEILQKKGEKKFSPIDKKNTLKKFEKNSEEYKYSKAFLFKMLEINPSYQYLMKNERKTERLIQNGADAVEKMRRIDGFTFEQVGAMMRFVIEDNFWQNQIITPQKFRRKNKDGLPYSFYIAGLLARGKTPLKNEKSGLII